MFKLIDKLRKKPERKRQGIVIAVSLSVTLVIAAFWLVSLVIKIQRGDLSFTVSEADKKEINQSIDSLKSSWNTFLENINSIADKAPKIEPASSTDEVSTTTVEYVEGYIEE